MSQALYRKYRSRSLNEIIGQEHITSMLSRAIASGDISHAYLLTGPRGVGKTSIARILAHEINKLEYSDESSHLDIIEIDAASNNGVEDVRDLREKVHIAPSSADKKIYIIDEVHMLSKAAFNALLKTLEEPPEHVVFILATTDADKLPATILSRVQRFNFRSITLEAAAKHLRTIADAESIDISDEALALIARHGDGSFRDSIGLLDQLRHSSDGRVEAEDVQAALGITNDDTIDEILEDYSTGNLQELVHKLKQLEQNGAQAAIITEQIINKLHSTIALHPENLQLLNSLLDVSSSSHPYIKLLSVLSMNTKVEPSDTPKVKLIPKAPVKADSKPRATDSKQTIEAEPSRNPTDKPGDFDWQKLLTAVKPDIALSSILTKCSHQLSGDTLIIFAGTKFNSERLKSPRQLPKLHEALQSINQDNYTIDIRAEKAPPQDSKLAAITAIMGGGEEVELHDA